MPKSAKRRKDKAADFAKAKLKLGKGKQAPSNAIDTSFKARSIALPSQSIAQGKDESAPTTRRKLTFDDLLVNLKHHNAGTRKDTIFGLRELLDSHWDLIDSTLPTIINATVRIIGDEDASVRKALLSFYSWLLPRIPIENLAPHAPLLLLFTTSAQTHIFPEIRVDGVRFLNEFLEYIPEAIVSGWNLGSSHHGSRVLEGYLGVLSAGTITGEGGGPPVATSTASVTLTAASKLVVLQSLSRFLQVAISSPVDITATSHSTTSNNSWFLSSSFTSSQMYDEFDETLKPSSSSKFSGAASRVWTPEVDMEVGEDEFVLGCSYSNSPFENAWNVGQLGSSIAGTKSTGDTEHAGKSPDAFVLRLATTLHPTLISVFLDFAPTVFSPSVGPSETEMELIVAVTQIARTLYGYLLQGSESTPTTAIEELKVLLGYMSAFFPFKPSGRRDVKVEQAFQGLNLMYCDLTSRLVLASRSASDQPSTSRSHKHRQLDSHGFNSNEKIWMQTERVRQYVLEVLSGEEQSNTQLARPLTPASYNSLLPTIWSLINFPTQSQEQSRSVLLAVAEHATRTSSKSVLKRSTLDFLARIVLLETDAHYHGSFRLGRNREEDEALEEWLTQLPQVLWELGPNNSLASEAITLFLLRSIQRRSRLIHDKTLTILRTRLAPYFHINHATRGQVLGPYAKLPQSTAACPSRLRRLVLDMVVVLSTPSSAPGTSLQEAVNLAVARTKEQPYWEQLNTLML